MPYSLNPDFPLRDFSHIDEAATIEVAKITGTCSMETIRDTFSITACYGRAE